MYKLRQDDVQRDPIFLLEVRRCIHYPDPPDEVEHGDGHTYKEVQFASNVLKEHARRLAG